MIFHHKGAKNSKLTKKNSIEAKTVSPFRPHVQADCFLSSSFVPCVTLCSLCLCGGIPAQQKPKKSDNRPPQIEKITEHTFRVGKALVDTQARTLTCNGEINMDEGAIEYLAVAPGGKTHESLLRIDVRPLHLQLALLMLDLEPKNVLTHQGDKNTPQGDPVELWIRWRDNGGKQVEARAEELVIEASHSRPMPPHNWVFTGSRILKQGFEADLEKSLVAVWHDPAAILDNPLPGGGDNGYLVNSKRTPKRGTRIELIAKAVKPAAKSEAGKSAVGGKP